MKNDLIIFGLSKGRRLAKEIASILKVQLGNVGRINFADKELLVYSETTVRGRQVFVCQSTSSPANDTTMELLIFIDSLKRASALTINVIVPYFGYARQDTKSKGRHPITASLVAKLLEAAGATRVITLDLHSKQMQGFFDIPVDHLHGGAVLLKGIKKNLIRERKNDVVVVSPDYGGVARAKEYANILGTGIAIIDKTRIATNKSLSLDVLGNVKNKLALIVDDMIDTGGTTLKGVDLLLEKGTKEVWIAATHPVFSNGALDKLQKSNATKVFVANTIDIPHYEKYSKLNVCTIAPYIADVIDSIANNKSITKVYKKYAKV